MGSEMPHSGSSRGCCGKLRKKRCGVNTEAFGGQRSAVSKNGLAES
jgi:hypothetical protein